MKRVYLKMERYYHIWRVKTFEKYIQLQRLRITINRRRQQGFFSTDWKRQSAHLTDCSVGHFHSADCGVGHSHSADCGVGQSQSTDCGVGQSHSTDWSVGHSTDAGLKEYPGINRLLQNSTDCGDGRLLGIHLIQAKHDHP